MVHNTCASVLLGIDGLTVTGAQDVAGTVIVQVVTAPQVVACCTGCGTPSSAPKSQTVTRPRDLPSGGRPVRLAWRKRRWYCRVVQCPRRTFTETVPQIPARSRLTVRLRHAAGAAVCDAGRTVLQSAHDHGVSWPVVQAAFETVARQTLPTTPPPTPVLGIDETRRGRRRFTRDPVTGDLVMVADCWHTGFVDLSGGCGLLGQVEGRTAAVTGAWLAQQGPQWRDQVKFVAIDMSVTYRAAIRMWLPDAVIVVDHFHVVQLANHAVTELRRRLTWTKRKRRGRKGDPEWDLRRLLTRNAEDLTEAKRAKLFDTMIGLGESGVTLLGGWIVKEKLRDLLALARTRPHRLQINQRLYEFYDWAAASGQPELIRLAKTIDTWWPQIAAFIATGISNAGSEGTNRVIKLEARNAYGFRNPANQRLRVITASTRRQRRTQST